MTRLNTPRTRARAGSAVAADTAVTEAMRVDAREVYRANKEKNKGTREATKATKALQEKMAQASVRDFDFEVDGKTVDVIIEAATGTAIDIKKLEENTDREAFMKIVTATQAAVKEHCGSNVLAMVSRTVKGDDKVKVKERK